MKIASQIKTTLEKFSPGEVFTVQSFDIEPQCQPALVRYLNKMISKNQLQRLSKGRYYKPRTTRFGELRPSVSEAVKDLLVNNDKRIGYISGVSAYSKLGLTTQISTSIKIGSASYRRPTERMGYEISTFIQKNPITDENIPLLQILDAVRDFKEIPAATPSSVLEDIIKIIKSLSSVQIDLLVKLSLKYSSYVRAIIGAIMELLCNPAESIRKSLNWVTTYKLGIPEYVLPTKSNWNIL